MSQGWILNIVSPTLLFYRDGLDSPLAMKVYWKPQAEIKSLRIPRPLRKRSETCVMGGRTKKQEKIWTGQVAAKIDPHFYSKICFLLFLFGLSSKLEALLWQLSCSMDFNQCIASSSWLICIYNCICIFISTHPLRALGCKVASAGAWTPRGGSASWVLEPGWWSCWRFPSTNIYCQTSK